MENITLPIRGYKVFNPDFTCRDFKFQVGETYQIEGPIEICRKGFHFCLNAAHCFSYYGFDSKNIVCEVEALGEVQTHSEDSKVCTDKIKIVRQLTWEEVLKVANQGKENTGHSNSGYRNSGDRNSGNWNSGNRNSGNWNSGDSNSGDSNSGDSNSGYSNSGYRNSGYRNSGNWNSGNWNSGDSNSGDSNSGDSNSGDSNSGYRNSGYRNSGNWNSGNRNSGNWNSGNWNSGDRNSGYSNSGYRNSGDRNSGDSNSGNWNSGNWNSGYRNSGDSNSGYRNVGAFCTDQNPTIWLFDKPTDIKVKDWERSDAVRTMENLLDTHLWIYSENMTDQEKEKFPSHKTTGGYLKKKTMHQAWADMWGNLNEEKRKVFTTLPHFDKDKFKEITGITL
jgi:hypothetical protein